MLNSPLNFIDPSGHREVRYSEGEWITQEIFSEYAGEWDTAEQARNCAIIETILSVGDTVAAILWEPYDWVSTGARCTQGGCNALDYAGFLPLIPGALGRVDDVAGVVGKIDDISDAAKTVPTHMHHTIPQQILKRLREDLADLVRGKKGAPNRWPVPADIHIDIHRGRGGGPYNARWFDEIRKAGGFGELTLDVIHSIRDKIVKEFGIDKFRP